MSDSRKQFEIWHAINHASPPGPSGTSPAARKRASCMKEVLFVAWQAAREALLKKQAQEQEEFIAHLADFEHEDTFHG